MLSKFFQRAILMLVLAWCAPAFAAGSHMVVKAVKGSFQDVRDSLVFAINGQGLVVNAVSHVGEMLERTGKDLGFTNKVYEHAEALEFCSAALSRKMMEADPDNIVFCPYTIYIYERPDQPGTVYLAYRRPLADKGKQTPVLKEVEKLYQAILSDAAQ